MGLLDHRSCVRYGLRVCSHHSFLRVALAELSLGSFPLHHTETLGEALLCALLAVGLTIPSVACSLQESTFFVAVTPKYGMLEQSLCAQRLP